MKNKALLPVLLILTITTAVVFAWFKEGLIIGTAESGVPFYNLARQLYIGGWAWADPALGSNTALLVGTTPTYWLLAQLEKVGLPAFAIEALLFWFLISIATVSIYFLTKELFPELDWKVSILASLFYLFNPFPIANIWARFLVNHMFAYAALPLLLLFYLMGLKRQNYGFALVTSLTSAVFAFALTSLPTSLTIWGILFFTTIFYAALTKSWQEAFFYAKYCLVTLITYMLVNSWWFGQLINFTFSKISTTSIDTFFSAQGNIDTLSALSQSLGSLTNTTRFLHGSFFAQGQDWAKFFVNLPMTIISFTITGLVLLTIFIYRKNKDVLFLGSLFLIGLYLTKGSNLPLGEAFEMTFVKFSFLQVFRNPFEKFGFLLILAAAPLFAKGMYKVKDWLKNKQTGTDRWNLYQVIYWSAFLFFIFIWGYPFWTSAIFGSNEKVTKEQVKSFKIEIPGYYKQVNNWFNNQTGTFRFLSLPISGEGVTYNWDKPYVGVDLSSTLFDVSNISNNTTVPFYSDFVSSISSYQLNKDLINFFPFFNGKYILERTDVSYKDDHTANPTSTEEFLNQLTKDGLVAAKATIGKIKIYQVSDKYFWPKIFVTPKIVVSNKSNLIGSLNLKNQNFPDETIAIVDNKSINSKRTFDNWTLNPELIYSPIMGGSNLDSFTDDQILSRLLWAKYLPGDPSYLLAKVKEQLEIPKKDDYWKRMVYQVDLLGKRAVEIYRMKKQSFNPSTIDNSEEEYISILEDTFDKKQFSEGSFIPDQIKESLLLQYLLAKKVDSKIQVPLNKMLFSFNVLPKFTLPTVESRYKVFKFDVSQVGDYFLKGEGESIDNYQWFIDGEVATTSAMLIDQTHNIFKLSKGIHEAAAVIPDSSDGRDDLLNESYLQTNQKKNYQKNIIFTDKPEEYKISLDFKFIEGNSFHLTLTQNIDKDNSPILFQEIMKNNDNHDWQHWEWGFTNSSGAVNALVNFKPVGEYICNKFWRIDDNCVATEKAYTVEIRNFKIEHVKKIEPILVSSQFDTQIQDTGTSLQWFKVNPTLYRVKVNKTSHEPEMLVLSELFDSRWRATIGNSNDWNNATLVENWRNQSKEYKKADLANVRLTGQTGINDVDHYLVNAYANGWLLDKPGTYDLTLEFFPQRIYDLGKTVSIATGILLIFSVIGLVFKGRIIKLIRP